MRKKARAARLSATDASTFDGTATCARSAVVALVLFSLCGPRQGHAQRWLSNCRRDEGIISADRARDSQTVVIGRDGRFEFIGATTVQLLLRISSQQLVHHATMYVFNPKVPTAIPIRQLLMAEPTPS